MRRTSQNLTETLIKKTPAPKTGRTYLQDGNTPGLTLQVTANGVKSFQLYGRINSKVKRITLGRWVENATVLEPTDLDVTTVVDYCKSLPILKLAMARKVCGLMRSHLSGQGARTPAQVKRQQNQQATLGSMLDEFEGVQTKLNTRQWIQSARKHLTEFLPKKPHEIEPEVAEDWHRGLCRSKSVYVANRALQVARAAVRHVQGKKAQTAFDDVSLAKEKARSRYIKPKEWQRFVQALDEQPIDWADYFRVLALTGVRKETALAMKWEDIDLDERLWTIPAEDQKNADPLPLPISPSVVAILSRRREAWTGSRFVFPGTGRTGHLADPKWHWAEIKQRMEDLHISELLQERGVSTEGDVRELAKQNGVDIEGTKLDLRIHDIRRTVGSYLAQGGVSMKVTSQALGHKDSSVTERSYAHMNTAPVRLAFDNLAKQMKI